MSKLEITPGVATGDEVQRIFAHSKASGYALPAVNVITSSSANVVLETAAKLGLPVIVQLSNAAAFGNVHGVYKPGNVQLRPRILHHAQEHVQRELGTGEKPVDFVFHSGSGSSTEEIREAISYGAIKMNIDTDTQWAYWDGVRGFYRANEGYLQGQIGNPEGEQQPNKKFYDPRVWLRKAEESMVTRLAQAFEDLNNVDRLA